MSKLNKEKKLILGSAMAGLILAGPGLSVTATSNAKFFQTAQLNVGYREAQAAKAKATPAPTPAPKDAKKTEDKHCGKDGKCGPDKHCAGKNAKDKHCAKDGKCSPDKMCGKDEHCAPSAKPESSPSVKSDLPPKSTTGKKKDKEMMCGEGACGK